MAEDTQLLSYTTGVREGSNFEVINFLNQNIVQFLLARNVTQAVAYLTAAFDSYERTHSDVTIYPDGTMLTQGQHLK